MTYTALVCVLLAAIASCAPSRADDLPRDTARADKPRAARPTPEVEHDTILRLHMHQSFDLLRAIERLLIRGKLEDARRFAEAISSAPEAPAHGAWAAQVVLVRDRAAALARATTVDEACTRAARVAAACAGCHVELGAATQLQIYPMAPTDKPTIEARMLRHRWAADRMWEGVIGGGNGPWRAGLDVLAAAPVELGPERAALARRLQQVASRARSAKVSDIDMRARVHGEVIATCAGCHTLQPASR